MRPLAAKLEGPHSEALGAVAHIAALKEIKHQREMQRLTKPFNLGLLPLACRAWLSRLPKSFSKGLRAVHIQIRSSAIISAVLLDVWAAADRDFHTFGLLESTAKTTTVAEEATEL